MDRINLVVVGYGMGAWHCDRVKAVPEVNLYGVCDIEAAKREKAAKDRGAIKLYATMDEVWADKNADLVVLALPHSMHESACVAAAKAKKHIIMEKPFCMTVKEADSMIQAAKRNKVMLTISHNRRWDLDYLMVKQQVDAGLLGLPFVIESRVHGYGGPRGWRQFRKFGGSILYDWGAHMVDQILQIRKYPKIESVYGDFQYRIWNSEVENNARATIRFADKTIALVEISQTAQIRAPRWFVMGDKGTLIQEAQHSFTPNGIKVKTKIAGLTVDLTPEPLKSDVTDFYRNVVAHLKTGAALLVKPEEARVSTSILEAAVKSAKTGNVVRL